MEAPERAGRTFRTASAFHGYLAETHRIECSYETVRRFFHEKGYALRVPRPWPNRQNGVQRDGFRERLRASAREHEIDLWFGDETGIEGEPKPRRRLVQKGSGVRVVRNGDHIRLSIMGIVCPHTGELFAIEVSHCDSDVFQAFLDEATRHVRPSRQRNILMHDNASWHKRKTLAWHFFEPIYLPPYSPDLNPIERLWFVLKAQWFNTRSSKKTLNRKVREERKGKKRGSFPFIEILFAYFAVLLKGCKGCNDLREYHEAIWMKLTA